MSSTDTITSAPPPPIRDRILVIDDFLPADLAESMRRDIDDHFSNPAVHAPETHQVWNYWYVPELYTYLRTQPEKVIRQPLVEEFHDRLRAWSVDTLGLANVTWPFLSLYVTGCKQSLHNDSVNGRFGFVYSLTRNDRRSTGGETIVHHEGDPFRSRLARPGAGRTFYDAIAPRFNRLVLFDDRMPHAVERVDGSMDPREGRFVLHGHISETGGLAFGALRSEAMQPAIAVVHDFVRSAPVPLDPFHGPLTLRIDVLPDGSVALVRVLLDRVAHADGENAAWPGLVDDLVTRMQAVRFPPADGVSHLVLPVLFGKLLPQR